RLRRAGRASAFGDVPVANAAAFASTIPADWRALTNRFMLVAQRAGYLSPSELLSFLESAQGQGGVAPEAPLDRWLKRSLWLSVLVLLVGGLALNLTPCVLPMIPVNLAIIGAGTGARSRRRGATLGALYGLGMAAAYGILGLLVVLTGSKFGALNASPWFNLSVAVLFAVLALAMFDVYAIDFSRFQGRFNTIGMGGGALVIVALGALAAILSGACVAPVVLSVLLLSASLYAQGHGAALLLPFILGLGMALPWPLAGAGLAWLPKPGRWMERIKHGFGVLILLAAVYYAYTGFTIWRQQPPSGARDGWLTSLPEALSRADREQKPVFIDFWASWCKNCHAMDATTFRNAQVRQQLESFVRVKVQAEHPNQPPDRDILDAFAVMGLPTYVVLIPNR
ncbi:MAG: thioredoxin family protein, partial [Kiritimatiellae bacterium]|nr:thioredoxin family protein [Kiritimatiellia bacterium]